MLELLLLSAAPLAAAPPAATWKVEGAPGAVRTIVATVRTGGRLVADGFVDDPAAIRSEKQDLSTTDAPPGSCARAAQARPFTRLRRFAADGRLLWSWRVADQEQALRLLAGWPGDCLSPDGGRLLVTSYRFVPRQPVSELGGAVIAVDRRPRFVEAVGARTGQSLDDLRKVSDFAWKRGADATLLLTLVEDGAKNEVTDRVVLGRRP